MNSRRKPDFHRKKTSSKAKQNRAPRPKSPGGDLSQAVAQTKKELEAIALSAQAARENRQKDLPFALDPWQQEAVDALLAGEHVVVDAPTTAGKTRVVESFFAQHIEDPSFRAAYTTPVKSLSNDKVREFRQQFGHDRVGIATGDIKELLKAPIVVATLESYRNSLLGVEPDLGRNLVIFDEYHFLQDASRGSAWEESIILSPERTQLLMLSASVSNAEEFCGWIEKIKKKRCRLIKVEERPVPLKHLVYFDRAGWVFSEHAPPPKKKKGGRAPFPLPLDKIAKCLASVEELQLTPSIVYAGRRLSCEFLAHKLCGALPPLSKDKARSLLERLESLTQTYQAKGFLPSALKKMVIRYGVAYHHSGLGPQGRLVIEHLLKEGALRYCMATMGLSIGINFAVRSALISDYRRPGSQGFVTYPHTEILQMLGRAGRRGQDIVGFSLWANAEAYHYFCPLKRERADSQIRQDPTTFLGLVGQGRSLKQIEHFYNQSFMKYSKNKSQFNLIRTEVLKKELASELPCQNPVHEFSRYTLNGTPSRCPKCPVKKSCHAIVRRLLQSDLAKLQLHLHRIGCLDEASGLTTFGSLARYFPQSGGLVLAYYLSSHEEQKELKLLSLVEWMAALSAARFKEPQVPNRYRLPFDEKKTEEMLQQFYPYELFREAYDEPYGMREEPIIREFNPRAGYLLREWVLGASFVKLAGEVCTEKFANGDLANMIFRTASFVQSLAQANFGLISKDARALWPELLRPPLTPKIEQEKAEAEEAFARDLREDPEY